MTQDNEYDLKPPDKPSKPKPGEPGWVEPVPIIEKADPVPEEPVEDPDVHNNKAMAILGYVLFLIPLVAAPKSKFARFHANQGLMVFILWCIVIFVIMVLEVAHALITPYTGQIEFLWAILGCFSRFLIPLVLFLCPLILTITGIINAANGEAKPLPLIGHWTLIK